VAASLRSTFGRGRRREGAAGGQEGRKEEEDQAIGSQTPVDPQCTARQGRLLARPTTAAAEAPPGVQRLGLELGRDGLVSVPPSYRRDRPTPLVVMLHGAGGDAQAALAPFRGLADAAGLLLLAPESRERTWDVLLGDYGPDVLFVNRALEYAFARYAVNPSGVAIEGFSDGASYALGLGLTNGDLFSHVVAFSPGFVPPVCAHGMPPVFISHGTGDEILPIARTSRQIVPRLREDGYQVRYVEFDGGHTVPAPIAEEAVHRLLSR
jgi:phospholipase/carboxylesterase